MSNASLARRPGHGSFFRVSARTWQALALLGLIGFALNTGAGVGGPTIDGLVQTWLYFALELLAIAALVVRVVLVPTERVAWACLAAGLAAYTIADLLWTFAFTGDVPVPSIADGFYLFFYPAAYVALLLLVRSRVSRFNRSLWLDGIAVALAVGAIGSAFLLEVVLDNTEGDTLAVATNLAYPLGDVVLLALVVGVFWLVGRDAGVAWLVIGGAFLATAVADATYLWTSSVGTYQEGSLLDILWPLMGILLALAAWVQPGRGRRVTLEGRPLVATPVVCTVLALVVFLDDHVRQINAIALVLAAAAIGVVLIRTVSTLRENSAITADIHLLSVTDPLTHLWNRRQLLTDLDLALESGESHVLVLYDLNGFKRFNDLFGHPAGDALLARLAAKLADVVRPVGACYRLGGDEFCVLARVRGDDLARFLDATSTALTEVGNGFEVTTAFGCAFLPDEATDAEVAMQVADQRLYVRKHHSLIERGQPHGVLLQALYEREPDLREHVGLVAELSIELGRRLGFGDDALQDIELAAKLHDIGKLAIPDAILDKQEPLTDSEFAFVRQHTVIGERILKAAPALGRIGVIVRATHEAFDGSGYPDGLAGAEIPLVARLIAVCDTYSAMTADRLYQARRSHDEALRELRSAAGSQLDPELVALFCATFGDEEAVQALESVRAARAPARRPS